MNTMLARKFNPQTQCWEAAGLTPIAAEVMEPLLHPNATLLDLFVVLASRDKAAQPGTTQGDAS